MRSLARPLANAPIAMLLTYRSDEVQPSLAHLFTAPDRERLAAELRPERLTEADVGEMLSAIFELDRAARPDFLRLIFSSTDGNPFFVEEVLRSLIVDGAITSANGTCTRKPVAELRVPRTVQDAVSRRADDLDPAARRVLVFAAVSGRRFDLGLLQALTGLAEGELLDRLRALVGALRFAASPALARDKIVGAMPGPDTIPQLERRLERLTKARPDLGEAAEFQAALVREAATAAREPEARGFPLPAARVAAKVREGVPLLHGEPAFVDVHYAADLFGRLVNRLAERDDPETRERVQAIVGAATESRLDPERLFTEAFVQHRDHLWELASLAGVDPDLLCTLAALSVAPLLRAYAKRLLPLVDRADDGSPEGAAWQRGYCPVCGAWPGLAELRGVELRRYLRCSACGSAWPARRLVCAYCGNDDFKSLSHLRAEGEPRFRVDTCQRCHGYLKSANAFDPAPAELLALEDLVSVDLDVAAIEAGFHRPADAGFRIELALPEEAWGEALADLD